MIESANTRHDRQRWSGAVMSAFVGLRRISLRGETQLNPPNDGVPNIRITTDLGEG